MEKNNDEIALSEREGDFSPDVDGDAQARAGLSAQEQAALADDDDQAGVGDDDAGDAGEEPAPLQADPAASADPAKVAADPGASIPREPEVSLLPITVDLAAVATDLSAVTTEIAALDAKYDNGELDFSEYRAAERALADQRMALMAQQQEAEIATRLNQQAATKSWTENVTEFLADNQEFVKATPRAALNMALNDLYADPKTAGASHNWLLTEAASRVRDEFNMQAPTSKQDDPVLAAATARAKETARARDGLPKTLRDAPEAQANDTGADEFSALDSLTGLALEQAISRMSPEQAERFARG